MPADPAVCRCGHPADAHAHLRKGSDCALCGRGECARFAPAGMSLMGRVSSMLRRARPGGVVLDHPRGAFGGTPTPSTTQHPEDDAREA